jgi:PAS domain S-box-containing protein
MFRTPASKNSTTSGTDGPVHDWGLINALPAAIYMCDADGRLTRFNDAAVDLWGRMPEPGKDHWCGSWKIYHLDGTPMALDQSPMAESLKTGKPVDAKEIIVERPNGERFNILGHPRLIFDNKGVLTGAINILIDVSEKSQYRAAAKRALKESEDRYHREIAEVEERSNRDQQAQFYIEELRQKNELLRLGEQRYHRMLAEVDDYAILMLDVNGDIQNWNRGAEKIKGYTAEEAIGKNFRIFYTDKDRENKFPDVFLNEATVQGKALHEGWRKRKNGTHFWGSVVLTALHNSQGEVIGFSKVTRDLTERKIAEENLLASSRILQQKNKELEKMNEELSSFAYISSHDLQEPLRKIQTFSDRIMELEYNNLSEKGRDLLKRMQLGALRMQTLIRDILTYSRTNISDKVFELTDFNDLVSQSRQELEVVISERNATIECENLPNVMVIPFQIQQLFTNLLSNALKFSKANVAPHITISCELVSAGVAQSTVLDPDKQYYHIWVQDNGIGFEPVYASKIFEVFQRLHGRSEYGGTGIGLAICKKIVENHNGAIRAEGQLDQGATFHVYLPVVP